MQIIQRQGWCPWAEKGKAGRTRTKERDLRSSTVNTFPNVCGAWLVYNFRGDDGASQTGFNLCYIHLRESFVFLFLFLFREFIENDIEAFPVSIVSRLSLSGNRNMLGFMRIPSAGPADAQKWAESFTALLSSKRKRTICGICLPNIYYYNRLWVFFIVTIFLLRLKLIANVAKAGPSRSSKFSRNTQVTFKLLPWRHVTFIRLIWLIFFTFQMDLLCTITSCKANSATRT